MLQNNNRPISIHALRVEGDDNIIFDEFQSEQFLSTPSGWRATRFPFHLDIEAVFLSTPSGWRATGPCAQGPRSGPYFYPRPPGGGRRMLQGATVVIVPFLSTPSGWRATTPKVKCKILEVFLSTPSGWRATDAYANTTTTPEFLSTPSGWRATRPAGKWQGRDHRHFYPRPPGGGRRGSLPVECSAVVFLSTPSGWRATVLIIHK